MEDNLETQIQTETETETEAPKQVVTQFDGLKYVFLDTSIKGAAVKALAYELIGYWGMNKNRRCYPSQTTLMKNLGIKSKDTLRSMLDQLILSGHFAVLQRPGRQTEYFPMFVKNARVDLLEASQQEVRDRLANKQTKPKMADVKKAPAEQVSVAEPVSNDVAPTPEVAPEKKPSHDFGSWVKTEADLVIANNYAAEMTLIAEDPQGGPPTGWPTLHVVSSVAETGLEDMWSTPRCYVSGGWGPFMESMPGRWVKQWGGNYGPMFSLSQIASVYDELFTTRNGTKLTARIIDEVDVAMQVLGKVGFTPSKETVNALRFAPVLDENMRDLRPQYQETLRARELCREHLQRGNYATTTDNR